VRNTINRGKANTATTAFARSRLPRSLLIAHSMDVAVGFVGVWGILLQRIIWDFLNFTVYGFANNFR
jgi:hypothetical protein